MPSLHSSPPDRPPLHAAAILLHAVWGLFVLVTAGITAGIAAVGSIIAAIAGVATQEDEAIPVIAFLAIVTLVLLVVAAMSALSLFLAWKAWGMQRFWIWALMIWSIVHLSTGCGIVLTILTVVGGIQALETIDGKRPAAPAD